MWSSKTADDIATSNYCGVKDAEIDQLIDQQKTEMDLAKRNFIDEKIDARLVALAPYVLMWNKDDNHILYWNKFGTPKYVLSKFEGESAALTYWWYDEAKAAALDAAMKAGTALPAQPEKIHYGE
jgi:microcin C transport system substrate-binding protein